MKVIKRTIYQLPHEFKYYIPFQQRSLSKNITQSDPNKHSQSFLVRINNRQLNTNFSCINQTKSSIASGSIAGTRMKSHLLINEAHTKSIANSSWHEISFIFNGNHTHTQWRADMKFKHVRRGVEEVDTAKEGLADCGVGDFLGYGTEDVSQRRGAESDAAEVETSIAERSEFHFLGRRKRCHLLFWFGERAFPGKFWKWVIGSFSVALLCWYIFALSTVYYFNSQIRTNRNEI